MNQNIPVPMAVIIPRFVAKTSTGCRAFWYRFASFSWPPKTTTVRIAEMTSSAIPLTKAYIADSLKLIPVWIFPIMATDATLIGIEIIDMRVSSHP